MTLRLPKPKLCSDIFARISDEYNLPFEFCFVPADLEACIALEGQEGQEGLCHVEFVFAFGSAKVGWPSYSRGIALSLDHRICCF